MSMHSDFRVETQTTGRAVTVTASGELDLVSSPTLEEALERVGDTDVDLVLLDLRGLEFMDSTGLHVLIKAHQRLQERGRQFAVIKGGVQVERLLSLTGVAELLKIVGSPEELLESDRTSDAP
jgi:anti-sigma B factor antagonist